MTKIHPEPVEIMTPIVEVPRLEAEASRNEEANRTARAFQRVMSREMMESLAYSVPKFDGKLEDWLIFRHFFVNRVHLIEEFTDTEKLLFLRHCVVGELGEQVARIGVSGANYSCAWAMIQGKFENKERELKARHMSLLLDLPEMAEESAEGLVFLIDNTRRHLQALRMINVNIPHDFLVVSLTKKLDPHTQFEWKSAIKDREPTVEEMLEFLMKKVKFIEEISRVIEQKRQRGEGGAYCVLCGSPDHYLYQCYLFNEWPVKDRIKFVENVGVCKKCLREHYIAECKFRNCYRCDGEHNVILHQDYQEPSLNASQQVVVTPRLNLKHFSTMNDEATSDEGISESGDSVSSQEEKYEYRQENKIEIVHDVRIAHEAQIQPEVQTESEVQAEPEVHIEHYIDHEGVFRGNEDILSLEISQPEKQNRQIEDGAYNVHHNAVPPGTGIVEMLSEGAHKGVSQGQESRMYPTPIVKEEESYKDAHQKDQIVILPEAANPENQNREYHENACQGDNNIAPAESVSQEDQFRDPQEEICQNNQNVVPLEAAVQEEQSMGPHLGDCHENQNLLPPETDDDDDEQEISIICQKTQNLDLHPVAYQEPTFEPQVSVCQQGGQNILVPPMVYQQAQYVAPPEVTYQVEGQNVMPHSMVYPQVQYNYPPEEAYDVPDQNISPPEMVYQPMQYMCSHMTPYQVDGQMMMPSGVIYQPEQYVVPPEQAYQQDDQNMVVYQPVQYMDPQAVNQDPQVVNQAISADSIMYGVPYYAAAQPLQQQQNMNMIHQQHAIQHQQAFQQQQMMQQQQVMQHQQVMQPQHVIHPHHAMQQQHIVHHQPQHQQQQQHIIHHQPQQHQQQQHIIHHQPQQQQQQQQHVIQHDYNIVQQPIRQVVIQQEANVVNQEGNNEQQGAHALQQQQGDENLAESNLQIVGRLRPDAEPFEPKVADGNKDVLLFASEGEVYVLSRLNYNAQEFVPQGQQPHEENPREVKSKIKQYLSRVVALLV